MLSDLDVLNQKEMIVWADDPDVEIIEYTIDRNAPHGVNSEEDKRGVG